MHPITKTSLFKYTENFTTKNWKFSDKNSDIFHISAQNIGCGYSLELPQWGSSNEYPKCMFSSKNKKNNVYPSKPQFYYIKVGFKGVNIIKACFLDATKTQISLCICTVWTVFVVSTKKLWILGYPKAYPVKILNRLPACTGWSESLLGTRLKLCFLSSWLIQWTLATTTAFVPKNVAIIMNLLF